MLYLLILVALAAAATGYLAGRRHDRPSQVVTEWPSSATWALNRLARVLEEEAEARRAAAFQERAAREWAELFGDEVRP